jgi:hypothetical protein
MALAERLRRQPPAESAAPIPATAPSPELSPDSYLAVRRQVERNADAWLARHDAPTGANHDLPRPAAVPHAWGVNFDQ